MRVLPRTLLLAALVLYAGFAMVRAGRYAYHASKPDAVVAEWALAWRIGGPAWRDLAAFAAVVEANVPVGSAVAFRAVPPEQPVVWRAAYLLPEYEIRPPGRYPGEAARAYAAVLRGTWDDPTLELVASHPLGTIYRTRQPTP